MMKNDLNSVAYDDLAQSVAQLETLEVFNCRLFPPQVEQIFDTIVSSSKLKDLNLKFNVLSTVKPETLADALVKIQCVNISGCRLKNDQVQKLFGRIAESDIMTRLDISQNDLSETSSEVMAAIVNKLTHANGAVGVSVCSHG